MEANSEKKCVYFSGLRRPFKTTGPTYNKNDLNSLAFRLSSSSSHLGCPANSEGINPVILALIFLRFGWCEMVPTWRVLNILSKIIITSLHLNKLNAYSLMGIALYSLYQNHPEEFYQFDDHDIPDL